MRPFVENAVTNSRYEAAVPRIKVGFLLRAITISRLLALGLVLSLGLAGTARAQPLTLLVFGDSLTAGYGLPAEEAFPVRLEAALRAKGYDVRVKNAGISGDTTAGGRARLAWSLAEKPDAVIVELGGNDGLRGIDPAQTRGNLDAMLAELTRRGIPTLLAGMYAPPNLGPRYGRAFNAIFPDLAKKHGVLLYPFFLDGVAAEKALNQPDGIHPNAQGVAVIVERILPAVERLLKQAAERKS